MTTHLSPSQKDAAPTLSSNQDLKVEIYVRLVGCKSSVLYFHISVIFFFTCLYMLYQFQMMYTKICVHTCVFELSRRGWENLNLAIQYNKSQLKISKNTCLRINSKITLHKNWVVV